jgi:hypothetical protein
MLLLAVLVIAILVGVLWAVTRAATIAARRAAESASPNEGPRAWSGGSTAGEPVVDVDAKDVTGDLMAAIQENNRLLREILDELRRPPSEPPPSSPGHLD